MSAETSHGRIPQHTMAETHSSLVGVSTISHHHDVTRELSRQTADISVQSAHPTDQTRNARAYYQYTSQACHECSPHPRSRRSRRCCPRTTRSTARVYRQRLQDCRYHPLRTAASQSPAHAWCSHGEV